MPDGCRQMIAPYLNMDIAAEYRAMLEKFSGLCDVSRRWRGPGLQ